MTHSANEWGTFRQDKCIDVQCCDYSIVYVQVKWVCMFSEWTLYVQRYKWTIVWVYVYTVKGMLVYK